MLKRIGSIFAFPTAAQGRIVVQASQPAATDIRERLHWGFRPLFLLMVALLVGISALPPCSPAGAAAVVAQPNKSTKPAIKSAEIPLNCPAKFITAMIPDGHGGVWVAGEDTGIYHGTMRIRLPRSTQKAAAGNRVSDHLRIHAAWAASNTSDSPGLISNSITALCVDGKGRLWAGTNRHGVCVYNGKKWAHYGILTGPIGCHVYAIAYDRYANQVWMATENGISIYQCGGEKTGGAGVLTRINSLPRYPAHTWHYITGINGLPANPDAIGFDSKGTAFIGTQCNGMVVATPKAAKYYSSNINNPFAVHTVQYQLRFITGPWRLPRTARGFGLPSNLIDSVMVTGNNHIYVGTDLGLAVSLDDGRTFRYERGADYAAKVQGLWHPPAGFYPPSQTVLNKLLPGDHITSVAQDAAGNIWLGTWRNGYEVVNPQNGQSYKSEDDPKLKNTDQYISELCPVNIGVARGHNGGAGVPTRQAAFRPRQLMLIGRNGFAVSAFPKIFDKPISKSRHHFIVKNKTHRYISMLPLPAVPPTRVQLDRIVGKIRRLPRSAIRVVYSGTDWVTQGDWVGRYGRQNAILCAAGGWTDDGVTWGHAFVVQPLLGLHARRGDGVRRWIEWLTTTNPRSLYDPWIGARTEAEWDDHGETYPYTWSSLGMPIVVKLPPEKAVYRVSIYFFNKDGHFGSNRDRDYLIRAGLLPSGSNALGRFHPVTIARVASFCNGVYQRFIIRGPGVYLFYVNRNFSLNTCVPGFFIDRLRGKPLGHNQEPPPGMGNVKYAAPNALIPLNANHNLSAAVSLWTTARQHLFYPEISRDAEILAYRTASASGAPGNLLRRWRWYLEIWTPADRSRFSRAIHMGFASFRRRQERSSAAIAAEQAAIKKGIKTYVYRGRWANP